MIVTAILENASAVVYCGFLVLFLAPAVLIRLCYILPGMVYFAAKKRVHWRGVWQPLGYAMLWVLIAALLYLAAYVLNAQSFFYITASATAIFCWVVGGVSVLLRFAFAFPEIQRFFYEDVYLKYATARSKKEVKDFIRYADTLYIHEAKALLAQKHLGYLERQALKNRVGVLES